MTKLKIKLINKLFFRLLENNKNWLFQCTYHNLYFNILHTYLGFFNFYYRQKGQNKKEQSRRNIQLDLLIICLKRISEENILIFVLRKMLLKP